MTYIYRALTGMILQSNDERFTRSLRRPEKGPRGFAARAWCGAAWRWLQWLFSVCKLENDPFWRQIKDI